MSTNKEKSALKVYAPVAIGALILALGVYGMIQPINNLADSKKAKATKEQTNKDLKEQKATIDEEKNQQSANMGTLKPFYEINGQVSTDSLASFGDMLENIIDNYVKPNGIMVRSIDYTLDPPEDPIVSGFPKQYHACALELYLICKYPQLHDMLYHLINDFPYYITLSQLTISAYPADKEYLLVNLTLGLYAKLQSASQ